MSRDVPRSGRRPAARTPLLVGAVVAVLSAAVYVLTLPGYGLVSDEGNYFESSRRLFGWADYFFESLRAGHPGRALADPVMEESWRWGGDRIPHPPLSRELAGLSGFLFYGRLDPLTAYRLLGTLVAGVLVGGVAAWGAARVGVWAGVVGGVALLLTPRVFAHAHFAGTDALLAALLFAAVFCAVEARRAPLVWAGAFWGLALATKFSAALLPLVLVPWVLIFRRERVRELPLFALVAAAAFVAVNPSLWADPAGAVQEYLRQGLARREISLAQLPTFYLGRIYTFRPPWHYPLVMLALTAPLGILLFSLVGAGAGVATPRLRPAAVAAVLMVGAFPAALMLPSAPVHDDIRLILPVFPFLAVLAGFGGAWLMGRRRLRRVGPALVLLALAEPALAVVRLHPFQASYFNVLAGGVAGADTRGLEVTGMKEALNREVYADLNLILPAGASLDGGPFLYEDLRFAQHVGWLRPDVEVRREAPADYLLLVNRRGWLRAADLALRDFSRPMYAVRLEGVPLVALYRLR